MHCHTVHLPLGALLIRCAMCGTDRWGDADFGTVNDEDTRVQAIKKGTVYLNIWMYAIHELEAAIAKCDVASEDMNNAAVHARATHRSAPPTPCPFPSVRTA